MDVYLFYSCTLGCLKQGHKSTQCYVKLLTPILSHVLQNLLQEMRDTMAKSPRKEFWNFPSLVPLPLPSPAPLSHGYHRSIQVAQKLQRALSKFVTPGWRWYSRSVMMIPATSSTSIVKVSCFLSFFLSHTALVLQLLPSRLQLLSFVCFKETSHPDLSLPKPLQTL
jgi:hypothetical protein